MACPRKLTWSLLHLVILGLLAGCAGRLQTSPPASDQNLDSNFYLAGKLIVRSGEEATSLRFSWQQAQDGYRIRLWGPLGAARTELVGDQAVLQVSRQGEVVAAGPAQEIMQTELGWQVPLSALGYWVRGRPDQKSPAYDLRRDQAQRLIAFSQHQTDIALEQFEGSGERWVPRRITVSRGSLTIKLMISQRG